MKALTVIAVAAALLSSLALAGCGDDSGTSSSAGSTAAAGPTVTLPEGQMAAADAKRVDAVADAIVVAGARGAWVGVWDPTKGTHTVAVGEAAPGRAATVEDNWRIGSITKTFTATVILGLVDEGKLSLDDTVADVDPDLAARFPPYAALTVRQLLAMESGIGDYFNSSKGIAGQVAANPQKVWQPDELIAGGIRVGVAKPGTLGYSTTNYIVLQEIAEKLTGTPLAEAIADRVAGPLGVTATTLPPPDDSSISDPSTSGRLAAPCVKELKGDGATGVTVGQDVTDWSVSSGAGGGAMQSNLTELATWAASVSGNSLLATATAAERLQTQLLPEGIKYGLGIMQIGPFYGHEGEEFGWEALALHDPATGRTIVLAGNACGIAEALYEGAGKLYPDASLL